MKKMIMAVLFVLASVTAYSQDNNKSVFDTWPELKAFHGVMSQTFHPSEEGNLEPIRTRIDEFKTRAEALADSKIPDNLNNEKVKTAVADLKSGAAALKKQIDARANDETVKKAIADLHDVFHKIVGLCMHPETDKH